MQIRPYRSEDLDEIMRVYLLAKHDELLEESAPIQIIPFTENPVVLALFQRCKIHVAWNEENQIMGFAGHEGNHIVWMYVHPEQRGKGVAYALITFIEQQLNGMVYLSLLKSNQVARRFYERVGYQVEQEFSGNYQGHTLYALKMVKQLPVALSDAQ